MKRKRLNLGWLLTLVVMALVLFTPLGFHMQVWVNRILSHNPEPVATRTLEIPELNGWRLKGLKGDIIHGDELQGQVVLINFWASWCPPCVAEMPSLDKLHEEFGDRVRFLFIARDQKDKVVGYLEKNNFRFPVYFESGLTPTGIYATGLPTTFVLDRAGRIVVAHTGAANWYAEDTRKLLDSLLTN
ncbi:TlpA family protein disulfide reductase [Lentiprolixibacter aurantiacus]|uniref:TlpA disulfide reductase family protein n=1 Tax=Lentiprolixibacter aurantiacus TaxID=2993939 RepID=A0AAE3SP17_9FLAO|nr:TlpA disulfide reductase family protein [Lentiprolixibacter aurantiacus]MCX2720135.1 TlpA disulfide reductase family protein [Lentiprolixibacter aurantiacus]